MRFPSLDRRTFQAALALLVSSAGAMTAQQSAAARSYADARAVLDRGIAAVGGLEALRAIQTIAVDFEGEGFARNQSARPEPPL